MCAEQDARSGTGKPGGSGKPEYGPWPFEKNTLHTHSHTLYQKEQSKKKRRTESCQ